MAKRGQNTGSAPVRRKDGRWESRLSLPDGRRRSFYGATADDAERKMLRAREELEAGSLAAPGRLTVAALGRAWLDAIEGQLRRNTVRGHRSRWDNHVAPVIGNVPLRAVSGAHVQRVLSAARRKGLSEGTVRELHHSMGAAFRHAVMWGLLARNPVRGVPVPPPPRRELPLDRPEQVAALLGAIRRGDYVPARHGDLRVPLLLTVSLGLRASEVTGLRWRDVDLDAGRLHIRHQVDVYRGAVAFLPVKTRRARRALPLPGFGVSLLRSHRARQNETRLLLGDSWEDHDLVFTGRFPGRPVSRQTLARHLALACAAAGVPRLTMHDLRHLCATILVSQGVSPRVAQEVLGHASIDTTMQIYTHLNPALLGAAAEAMEAVLADVGG